MSWKHVVEVSDVRDRMSLPDLADINNAIDSSLTAAHACIQGILDTTFERKTGLQDFFYMDSRRFLRMPDGMFRMRLRKGFVNVTDLSLSFFQFNFNDPTVMTYGVDYTFDPIKGIVRILAGKDMGPIDEYDGLEQPYSPLRWKFQNSNLFARITYDCGFDDTHAAPDFLGEVVLAYVGHILNNQQNSAKQVRFDSITKEAREIAGQMLEPYMRGRSLNFRPYHFLGS